MDGQVPVAMRLASGALHFAKCGRQACVGIDVDVFRSFIMAAKASAAAARTCACEGLSASPGGRRARSTPVRPAPAARGKVVEGSLDHPDRPPSALLVVGALEAALNMASCGWIAA